MTAEEIKLEKMIADLAAKKKALVDWLRDYKIKGKSIDKEMLDKLISLVTNEI